MNIVSFGGGTNSAAVLVGMYQKGIPIDLILFADTGAEHPHTYRFIETMDAWLAERGLPKITVVKNVDRYGNRFSLEMECIRSNTLPSIAYGNKRCSHKHKIAPQDKFCNNYPPCREVWAQGERVYKFIGFDADEQRRRDNALKYDLKDKKYIKQYPLIAWGWNRNDCVRELRNAGLPQPGKSSCFFCPSMKKPEIEALKRDYPELFNRAIAIESAALPHLIKVKGLGRNWSWKSKYGTEDRKIEN